MGGSSNGDHHHNNHDRYLLTRPHPYKWKHLWWYNICHLVTKCAVSYKAILRKKWYYTVPAVQRVIHLIRLPKKRHQKEFKLRFSFLGIWVERQVKKLLLWKGITVRIKKNWKISGSNWFQHSVFQQSPVPQEEQLSTDTVPTQSRSWVMQVNPSWHFKNRSNLPITPCISILERWESP